MRTRTNAQQQCSIFANTTQTPNDNTDAKPRQTCMRRSCVSRCRLSTRVRRSFTGGLSARGVLGGVANVKVRCRRDVGGDRGANAALLCARKASTRARKCAGRGMLVLGT